MSAFTQDDLDRLCKALQSEPDSSSAIPLTNSLFDLAKQHSVIWPLMSAGRLQSGNPLVGALTAQTHTLAQTLPLELSAVHAALSEVCAPVYLKGAAILIEHNFTPQFWRYMADFDMLVEPEHLTNAVSAIGELGYHPREEDLYLPRLNPHFPILLQAGKTCGIEIHTRLLQDDIKNLLEPDGIRARADNVETSEGTVLIASIYDRLIHLIAHAQIGSQRYHRRKFLIRDALEFNYLLSRPGADYQAVREAFQTAGYLAHFDSFVAMSKALIPSKAMAEENLSPNVLKWAKQARENILDCKRQNRWVIKDLFRMGALLVYNPSKWGSYAKLIGRGQFFSQRINKQLK